MIKKKKETIVSQIYIRYSNLSASFLYVYSKCLKTKHVNMETTVKTLVCNVSISIAGIGLLCKIAWQ